MKMTGTTPVILPALVTRRSIATYVNAARIRTVHFVAPETPGAGMEPSF